MRAGAPKEPRISGTAIFDKGWPSRKATLYVYVEGAPSLEADLLAEACDQASRQWQQSRLSATAALQEAVAAAIRAVTRGAGAGTAAVGVTCAVLQDGGVYLAQGGTTRAYILGPLVCRRVAPSSPWDLNHVDVREEPLAQASVLLLAPSVLEDALPLLQGGLPPREVQRLIKAWLQDKPQLSALVVGLEDGREVALAAGARVLAGEEKPGPQPDHSSGGPAQRRPAAVPLNQPQPGTGTPAGREPFPVLRALRIPLAVMAALLALLVLGGVVWYLPGRQKGEDELRLAGLLDKANLTRQEANLYSDPVLARGMLAKAESLAREAAGIRPKDKRVAALQQDIGNDLDRVNSVLRPAAVTMLVDLGKEGGSQSLPSRVIVDANNLYVLDRGVGRVYKFILDQNGQAVLNTANKVLVRKGDSHGGSPLGDLWEAVWVPPGPLRATGSLLVLDAQGLLLEYRPDKGVQVLPLRGVRGWASFRGARGFSGNLYILDAAGKQIWRYLPTSTGYDSEARGILEDADIADAADLAIDGDIYIMGARGTLQKFAGGLPRTFAQDKMDRPLLTPAAVFANPATNYVYVADKGNGRIVAFDKEGVFRFQVRADALEGVQGLFVDEGEGRIYFVSGQKVFVTTVSIPPIPKP